MDPFMNQGDQLDQGGKVDVENFSRKNRPNSMFCALRIVGEVA